MASIKRRDFMKYSGCLAASSPRFPGCPGSRPADRDESIRGAADPWLEVDLKKIRWNYAQVRKQAGNRPVMAVVKNNAYGLGLIRVGKCLEKLGVFGLAVGKLREAVELREAGVRCPILNFGPFLDEDADLIVRHEISQSVFHDNVRSLDRAAAGSNRRARVHIKVDTGMGRVGVPYYSAMPFIEKTAGLEHVKIDGMFSVFTENEELDRAQLERLKEVGRKAGNRGCDVGVRHMCSSSGILKYADDGLDVVRPGICLYGHYPSEDELRLRRIDLKPAMSMKARVSCVKKLRPGDAVSYHGLYTAGKEEMIYTAGIGYGDGYPDNAAGRAHALLKGEKLPVFVDVTANHTYLKAAGTRPVDIGDEIVLFGEQGSLAYTADDLARDVDISVYRIITKTNPLTPRIYRD